MLNCCVLVDVLLEQILVGPSPNLQLLSYLRHAVATQVDMLLKNNKNNNYNYFSCFLMFVDTFKLLRSEYQSKVR